LLAQLTKRVDNIRVTKRTEFIRGEEMSTSEDRDWASTLTQLIFDSLALQSQPLSVVLLRIARFARTVASAVFENVTTEHSEAIIANRVYVAARKPRVGRMHAATRLRPRRRVQHVTTARWDASTASIDARASKMFRDGIKQLAVVDVRASKMFCDGIKQSQRFVAGSSSIEKWWSVSLVIEHKHMSTHVMQVKCRVAQAHDA
jgi:hypothetical protein